MRWIPIRYLLALPMLATTAVGCSSDDEDSGLGGSEGSEGSETSGGSGGSETTSGDEPTGEESSGGGSESVDFIVTIENVTATPQLITGGAFNTPVGASEPGPLTPGDSYEITFTAAPGYPARTGTTRVTFAAMFVPSNDLFFAPGPAGIALYDDEGNPRSGDVTDEVAVWDAGTEADEPLNGTVDESPNQVAFQNGEFDVGPADPDDTVRLAEATYPGEIPDIGEIISVSLSSEVVDGAVQFTLTLTNASSPGTLGDGGAFGGAIPISPGAYAVYDYEEGAAGPMFTPGEATKIEGLEEIAEDGNAAPAGDATAAISGLRTVSSPGAWAVHSADVGLFEAGTSVAETGLESIAEDGNAADFVTALGTLDPVFSSGQVGEAPLPPGMSYTIEFSAEPGDLFSFVTMFVPSNDLLFTNGPDGIALFDADGNPITGDITSEVGLWDAGTEVNQELGVGLDQVHLQAGPNTGDADPDPNIRLAPSDSGYPAVADSLRVTIQPAG